MSNEVWLQVYARLADLIAQHRTTLVFVNTRRMAERVTRHLSELLGSEHVMAHHGSMAKERRLAAEQRLKAGELRALVATASLELGIDIGDVELVCQLGSTRRIATFLQRAGRASHSVGGIPKARLFPLSRDELVECAALLDAVARGELDRVTIPPQPLDVLAQQIVAEVAAREWPERELFEQLTRASPYAALAYDEYLDVVRTLADGFTTRHGHRAAYVHRDAVNNVLRGRRGARLTALTSGGAIPDTADYDVVLEPAGQLVGTVNEDFAVESLAGDVFQLGNTSYRIRRIEAGRVRVEDAQGQAPNIPFWLGEAPARSDELSQAVARLRTELFAPGVDGDGVVDRQRAVERLEAQGVASDAGEQLVEYLATAKTVLGVLPTQDTIVLERFFDESGGMQLVIHAPFGSRINRAWGLALRKRFCVKFNFELQAAATEDAIVLSLSTSHSFTLTDVARYLHSNTVRPVVVQAMLEAPMFAARWRWIAGTSLALPRFRGGKKIAAPLQRMRAEDLLASVFPDQIACAENLVGEREIPDHPLVRQVDSRLPVRSDGHRRARAAVAADRVRRRIDRRARPAGAVAAGDGNPQRAALRVSRRRAAGRATHASRHGPALGRRRDVWRARTPRRRGDRPRPRGGVARRIVGRRAARRAAHAGIRRRRRSGRAGRMACAARRTRPRAACDAVDAAGGRHTHRRASTAVGLGRRRTPAAVRRAASARGENAADRRARRVRRAIVECRRSARRAAAQPAARTWGRSPRNASPTRSRGPSATSMAALARLATEGVVMAGAYTGDAPNEWCDRSLLARIHRYTVNRLRQEIEPVTTQDFMRFLLRWQHVAPGEQRQGPDALDAIIGQLQGFEAPAAAWEAELLPARLENYDFTWLDDLCLSGRAVWTRLAPPAPTGATGSANVIRTTPVTLLPRRSAPLWTRAAPDARCRRRADELARAGGRRFPAGARRIVLRRDRRRHPPAAHAGRGRARGIGRAGARDVGQLRRLARVADAVAEAQATGRGKAQPAHGPSRRRRCRSLGAHAASRRRPQSTAAGWTRANPAHDTETIEHIAHALLRRYGVVAWKILQREAAWLPPWRELVRVLRRLEARGDIRGGRFVASVTGEQFASPEAVAMLRETRRAPPRGPVRVAQRRGPAEPRRHRCCPVRGSRR